mmetsp:Transcript_10554/g.5391  ORF Transcript_10554/g.5391 Transcript_10554/m.5391 type:complete len:318 (-) Transcript_10554:1016-1969(-)
MMSLSDVENDQFQQLDISPVDKYNEEISNRTDETKPDLSLFKMLFEVSDLEKKACKFEELYDVSEQKEVIFEPLIEIKDKPDKKDEPDVKEETLEDREVSEQEALEALEEKRRQQGFEKGLKQGIEQGIEQGVEQGIEQGQKQGYEEGFEKGEAKGFEKGIQDGEEKGEEQTQKKGIKILNSLEESLRTADSTLDLLVERYEEPILCLIEQITKKVIMAQVEINDEIVKNMIMDALKTLVQPEQVALSVSLDDYEYIEMIKDEFFENIGSLNNVSVRSDPSISRGGCKIETITASVSTDIDSRLEAVFEAIKNAEAV